MRGGRGAARAPASTTPDGARARSPRRRSRVTTVEPVDEQREERGGFAFFAVLLLYGQLIGFGYFVAMGVVEEKSSRVVEVLLSTHPAARTCWPARSSGSACSGSASCC